MLARKHPRMAVFLWDESPKRRNGVPECSTAELAKPQNSCLPSLFFGV
ncbi:hypothetical protein BRYFOR_06768 [Marvinbryantia formatexigens DSM 14469]|uniref:Uncharacterized protein n=1 Tax=Marvinbryantia formatexigens DSM 14469 TaxID=478749 RepID=C6LDR9_9FIRM|nr:hypothetical protein BRYFOR_06768 [Marvinbryantia formatexigens DSM 14469]